MNMELRHGEGCWMWVSRTLWLGKMQFVQEHSKFQTQPGKFPTCGNLGQGVLLGGFPLEMGHQLGNCSPVTSTEGQLSLQKQEKVSRPNDWFPCWENKR